MSINLIAAVGENYELGKNNQLIWHLPKDLKFFKNITKNKIVVMGRKTFESLPNGLPDRKLIVISSKDLDKYYDVICYHQISEVLNALKQEDYFVIGGSSIYEQFLPFADNLYLTEVNAYDYEADTYFPYFDTSNWYIKELEFGIDNGIEYQINKYTRKRVKK